MTKCLFTGPVSIEGWGTGFQSSPFSVILESVVLPWNDTSVFLTLKPGLLFQLFLSCSNCCSCGADVFPGPSDECSSCFADVVFSKVCAFQSVHWATLFCIRNVVLFRDLMVLKGRWKVLVTCVRITRVCFSETPWTN